MVQLHLDAAGDRLQRAQGLVHVVGEILTLILLLLSPLVEDQQYTAHSRRHGAADEQPLAVAQSGHEVGVGEGLEKAQQDDQPQAHQRVASQKQGKLHGLHGGLGELLGALLPGFAGGGGDPRRGEGGVVEILVLFVFGEIHRKKMLVSHSQIPFRYGVREAYTSLYIDAMKGRNLSRIPKKVEKISKKFQTTPCVARSSLTRGQS